MPICQKRAKVYVAGFVEPITGQWVSYLVPALDSSWYSQILGLLADHYKGEAIKLIVDQAGWHLGKEVVVPESICMEFLPAHSPELNPTEQVWGDVRYNHTRNEIITESEVLWEILEQTMKIYSLDPDRVKSITNQEWLYGKNNS